MLHLLPTNVANKIRQTNSSTCWQWIGAITSTGYGHLRHEKKYRQAHRVVYELLHGPIPYGLTLDHLCRNRTCVNPEHLEAVTMRVNILRGTSPCANNARIIVCAHGHEYDALNTYTDKLGKRHCRACHREREYRRYQARRK